MYKKLQYKLRFLLLFSILLWFSNAYTKTVIPYCVDPSWLPYEAIDNNQHIGLSSEYIKILQTNTTYTFELVPTDSWQQTLQYIQSGQCLLIPMLNESPERSSYMDFSAVYFTSPNFIVSTQEQPFLQSFEHLGEQSLGVITGYRITQFIEDNFPAINTIAFNSELEGLKAVANGEVDLFIGSALSINNQIQNHGLNQLKLAGWAGLDDSLRMGVKQGETALLTEINRVLGQISDQQHFEIYNQWNAVKIIDNTNYKLIWQISAGGALIFFLLMVRYFVIRKYNRELNTKNRQLNELQIQLLRTNSELQNISQHDELTGLFNRHYFNQLLDNRGSIQATADPLCLILLDLDYFKKINDNHGHVIGDHVLKTFGQVLNSCCQHNELVCRWGGEEFVILKQPSSLSDAQILCQNIQTRVAKTEFPQNIKLTCSFGIAQLNPGEDLMVCFERADSMLYLAKDQGRDRVCLAG